MVGLFGLLLLMAQRLLSHVQQNVEMQVFLDHQAGISEVERIRKILSNMEALAQSSDGKPTLRYLSKTEATHEFAQEMGEDFMQYLDETPLRDVFFLGIDKAYQSPAHFAHLKQKIERLHGVFEVVYVESLIASIYHNLTKIAFVLMSVAVLLFLSTVMFIHHAIRLSMFSQRFLIRSMQLVGATRAFIRSPFLNRATLYGGLASLLALFLLYVLLQLGSRYVDDLHTLHTQADALYLGLFIVGVGIGSARLSTYFAVQKYLKLSLDELY